MIPEPLSIAAITSLVVSSTPHMLEALRGTLLDKGKEVTLDKGKEFLTDKGVKLVRGRVLHLDEREQRHHLEQALKNAVERGLIQFGPLEERDRYRDVLANLFEAAEHNKALQQEALRLFSFSEKPDFSILNEAYNRSLQSRNLSVKPRPKEVDTTPYLTSFFDALIAELYADSFFKQQMSNAIQLRAAVATVHTQQSVLEIVKLLREMNEILSRGYSAEQLEQDLQTYTTHLERSLRYIKIVSGVLTKDHNGNYLDSEINSIFVPLRIAFKEQELQRSLSQTADTITRDVENGKLEELGETELERDEIILSLEQFPYLVLLGSPGSGKSTITRQVAWSHAAAYCADIDTTHTALLARRPLPLRIELRSLVEERRRHEYDFLSYVTEVILKREGLEINQQMFKELLTRKAMVLLFDGLDEVATLAERRRLVEEIEGFALRYPANYMLVTSRPVGYELAPISTRWFAQAEIQEFDDVQILQFLELWYAHVLRLSPLPSNDRQELETLYKTLQDNPRLHKLAVNPLLLTVITALHRYEHLPDKRILVYDRCAELLLDSWAVRKGTDVRWQNMKMSKYDQYACVAHLGFVLQQRSQEQSNGYGNNDPTNKDTDVPSRFLRREIERFLNDGGLIKEVGEQRIEAERFLELMKVETGLIVEHGMGENDEVLYGFVHRTFQEYFAAIDVYIRYSDEEEPAIINEFLVQHLHDPYWQEVILLLLGKLGRNRLTARLQQMLDGKIVSHRSHYTNILQQDLFFFSTCLEEELEVGLGLAETVVELLATLIEISPFSSQRENALARIFKLLQTRSYHEIAREKLAIFLNSDKDFDLRIKIQIARELYRNSVDTSKQQDQAFQVILGIIQNYPTTSYAVSSAIYTLYEIVPDQSEQQNKVFQVVVNLIQNAVTPLGSALVTAYTLYKAVPRQSVQETQVTKILQDLAQRQDLAVDKVLEKAEELYKESENDPEYEEKWPQSKWIISGIAQRPDLSIDQLLQLLYIVSKYFHAPNSETQKLIIQILSRLLRKTPLFNEQKVHVAVQLYRYHLLSVDIKQEALELFKQIVRWPTITAQLRMRVAMYLISLSSSPQEELEFLTLFLDIIRQNDIPKDLTVKIIANGLNVLPKKGFVKVRKQLLHYLSGLYSQIDLSTSQAVEIVEIICKYDTPESQEKQGAIRALLLLLQKAELSFEDIARVAKSLYKCSSVGSDERCKALQTFLHLTQSYDLNFKQISLLTEYLSKCYSPHIFFGLDESTEAIDALSELTRKIVRELLSLLQKRNPPVEQMLAVTKTSYSIVQDETRKILLQQVQESTTSFEDSLLIAKEISQYGMLSPFDTEEKQQAEEILLTLLRRSDISFKQAVQAADALYKIVPDMSLYEANEKETESNRVEEVERQQKVIQVLWDISQKPELSHEQALEANQKLYEYSYPNTVERQYAARVLQEIAQNQGLTTEQRLQAAVVPLAIFAPTNKDMNYQDKAYAVRTICTLLPVNEAKKYIAKHWGNAHFGYFEEQNVNILDVPYLVELVQNEILPEHIRSMMYSLLSEMIPRLNEVSNL